MQHVGLANTRISTDYAQKSPGSLFIIERRIIIDLFQTCVFIVFVSRSLPNHVRVKSRGPIKKMSPLRPIYLNEYYLLVLMLAWV